MQLTKPLPPRVRVVITDANGQAKSESLTIYNATPVEVRGVIQQLVSGHPAGTQPVSGSDARLTGMASAVA